MTQYKTKEEIQKEKKKGQRGKKITSGRHATGNAHQRATRKKPQGKYQIQRGKQYYQNEGEI